LKPAAIVNFASSFRLRYKTAETYIVQIKYLSIQILTKSAWWRSKFTLIDFQMCAVYPNPLIIMELEVSSQM